MQNGKAQREVKPAVGAELMCNLLWFLYASYTVLGAVSQYPPGSGRWRSSICVDFVWIAAPRQRLLQPLGASVLLMTSCKR